MQTFYEILGITRSTNPEDLKQVWRLKSRLLHPDRNEGSFEATSKFAELSAAYAVLSDPKARLRYDNELALVSTECPYCEGQGVKWRSIGFTGKAATKCKMCNGVGRIFNQGE
jgi:DnaJ-class molecular chaperone